MMSRASKILGVIQIIMVAVLIVMIVRTQIGTRDSETPMADMQSAVMKEVDTSSMQEGTNLMLKKFYGLDASEYDSICLYIPYSNMDAEEVLIVKLADDSQAEAVEAAINERVEKQKSSFEGYGVEQYDLLEKHILDVKGNYILYIVHSDASKADEAFRNSL